MEDAQAAARAGNLGVVPRAWPDRDAAAIVGESGWVVPPHNSGALAGALIEAIDAPPESLRARGAAARARIEAEFSISSVVAQYIALYERLIEERR